MTGNFFFGNDQVSAEELPAKIRERLSHGAERVVYLRAAARVKYGTESLGLDAARAAGVERIAILVNQRKASPAAQ